MQHNVEFSPRQLPVRICQLGCPSLVRSNKSETAVRVEAYKSLIDTTLQFCISQKFKSSN